MIKYIATPGIRSDSQGDGHFGSPRGGRTHRGIDFDIPPGCELFAPVSGEVNKIGYAYGDDLRWRYIQIRDEQDLNWRIFYVKPDVSVGDNVMKDVDPIGVSDDISSRYPGMTPHIHLEIKDGHKYLDPGTVIS